MSNPTKANSLSSEMPAAAGEEAPVAPKKKAPLPGKLTKAERDAKKAAQQEFEAEKARREQAAQGAAGGGGDDGRREDVLAALAFVKEVEREAEEVLAPIKAKLAEVVKELVERDKRLSRSGPSKSKGPAFHISATLGPMMTSVDKLHAKKVELESSRDHVKGFWDKIEQKARADVDAVRAGTPYAAILEEREAVRRQNQAPEPESKESYQRRVRESIARGEARNQRIEDAKAWAKAQPYTDERIPSNYRGDSMALQELVRVYESVMGLAALPE